MDGLEVVVGAPIGSRNVGSLLGVVAGVGVDVGMGVGVVVWVWVWM